MGRLFEEPLDRPGLPFKYDVDLLPDDHKGFAQLMPLSEQQFATRDELAALADRVRDLETAHVLRGRL